MKKTKETLSLLTEREHEIMECLMLGLSLKMTADKLKIAIDTVKNHRKNIRHKLGAVNAPDMTYKYMALKA